MEKPSNRVLLKGIFLSPTFYNVEAIKRMQDEFEVRNQDVIIVTYPKSGTHWMIDIISLIYSKGDPTWVKSVPFWKRSPWIEMEYGMEMVKNKEDPRLFTSHLPIHLFPKAYFTSKAKVIYLARDPKDVIVSLYHFQKEMPSFQSGFTFEHVIENFQQGNDSIQGRGSPSKSMRQKWAGIPFLLPNSLPVSFGSWFDHIKGWLSRKDPERFLLLNYEKLHQDLKASVEKICHFLGKELSEEEISSVLKNASFPVMKKHILENKEPMPLENMEPFKVKIMRKGICGDWKNHFTVTQADVFNKLYQEKMEELGTDLFPWDQC
ncbi:sulfotransferase 2A1-like [Monodelphis domestica]|uniref:sulfotransferase 2A1-like n=1 Tax=Monodelphis domestica TaxID=13616 RepID=UPI0024E26D8E|nr:sulfotransferase 2A1-like [Monodelphis domestica]